VGARAERFRRGEQALQLIDAALETYRELGMQTWTGRALPGGPAECVESARMATKGAEALREELGTPAPKALSSAEAADLVEAIRTARERQSAELHAAIDAAYHHIPRLLRGPVRKVLGG